MGTFRSLNLDKARHIITRLGGAVVETASPALPVIIYDLDRCALFCQRRDLGDLGGRRAGLVGGVFFLAQHGIGLRGWIIDGWY